jgi:hypothetical protein
MKITRVTKRERTYARGELRQWDALPRLYIFPEGESIVENFAYRFDRPSRLYREVLPEILDRLGLPTDTKCSWSQRAGCGCGCSPGFVVRVPQKDGTHRWDAYVTVTGDDAIVDETANAVRVAGRVDALVSDPTMPFGG